MKTAQQIAQNVEDPANSWKTRRLGKTAPGAAQQTILDALEVQANNYAHACEIFSALGIGVGHKRVGRSSVPVVSKLDLSGGGFNIHGEGESWEISGQDVDLSAIAEWMEEKNA